MSVTTVVHAQDHGHDASKHHKMSSETSEGEGRFSTVGFEEHYEVTVPFSNTKVCPLFEPAGRFLMYDWWNPTVLREAEEESLEGLIVTTEVADHGVEVLLTVTRHAPDEGRLQYIVLWGDFELQRIDITCAEGETADSTKVVWHERNAGIHENGVSMVTHFIETGGVGHVVERYAQNATKYLQDN